MEPHVVTQMGAALRREAERQLLADLDHYRPGSSTSGCTIDWSNPCQEGHCTDALDGLLEEMSDVIVRDHDGNVVADGWLDFVHGGAGLPLHVFWLFLDLAQEQGSIRVKDDVAIPVHVWARLSDASKDACSVQGRYDSRWEKDPKVQAWTRDRGLRRQPVGRMTNRPPEAKKDLEAAHTIAAAWRPVFTEIVRALVEGDYTLSGGVPRVRPVAPETGDQMRKYVEQYGATLVELPKESWQTSVTQWMGGYWEVLVDLWTAEEGRSDLVLHSRVIETEDSFEIELCSIHVP